MYVSRAITRLVAAGALVAASIGFVAAAPAGADPVAVCNAGQGLVHASPGVTNTPHAQTVKLAAKLTDCTGGLKSGVVNAHFDRTGPITCADVAAGGGTLTGTVAIKWNPKAKSAGTITATLGAGGAVHVTGAITNGLGKGSTFAADATATPLFKPKGTPCTAANKAQYAEFSLTGPVTVG